MLVIALLWTRLEKHQQRFAWTLLAVAVVALAARTVVRNRDWRDNYTLFAAGVRAVPESAKVHAGLGGEYLRRDQLEDARNQFRTSIDIYPDFADVWDSYGLVESRLDHDQEARKFFEKSLAMTAKDDANYDYVAVNLAGQLIKLGKNDDALKLLNEEIATSPGSSRAWSNRAAIWYQRGEVASARADAEAALRLDPRMRKRKTSLLG